MKSSLFETSITSLSLYSKGKVRDNYEVEGDKLLMVATDRISAFDVIMNEPIPDKGKLLTRLTLFWFNATKSIIENHLTGEDPIKLVEPSERQQVIDRSIVVKKLHPIPIEAIVRGYLSGSAFSEYKKKGSICNIELPNGLVNASKFSEPIFTPATKAKAGSHDENISLAQMIDAIGYGLSKKIEDVSIKLYSLAYGIAFSKGIIIADTKFEFGLDSNENLVLMDEILTPDSSRFWSLNDYREGSSPLSYDKQFVRDWLELFSNEGKFWDKKAPAPNLPAEIIERTYQKYVEAVERLTA